MCTNTQRWGSVCVCSRKVHAVFVRGFQCAGSCGKCQNRQQTAERTTTKTTPAAVPIRSEAINPGTSGNSDRSLLLLLATTSTVRARHYTYYYWHVCVCYDRTVVSVTTTEPVSTSSAAIICFHGCVCKAGEDP